MAPSRKTTLGTSGVMRQLGIVGSQSLGEILDEPLRPTIQVADVSRSFTTETVEPRGVAGTQVTYTPNGPPFYAPTVKFLSLSEGIGSVIENVQVNTLRLGATNPLFNAPPTAWGLMSSRPETQDQVDLFGQFVAGKQEIGGPDTRSQVTGGALLFSAPGPTVPFQDVFLVDGFMLDPNARWFVPNGVALYFVGNSTTNNFGNPMEGQVQLSWREIIV